MWMLMAIVVVAVSASTNYLSNNYPCSDQFVVIGRKCYYFSNNKNTWNDAFYSCEKLNSTLAIVSKARQEQKLRNSLSKKSDRHEYWIGGQFDWERTKWVWRKTGKPMLFDKFAANLMITPDALKWHCAMIENTQEHTWGASSCLEQKRYICQTKVKKGWRRRKINNNSSNDEPAKIVARNSPKALTKPYKEYVCPAHMIIFEKQCYWFSAKPSTWIDAYSDCQNNMSQLADIKSEKQNKILRTALNNFIEKHERWLDGKYNVEQNKWMWAKQDDLIKYTNFAQSTLENKDFTSHCITLDPSLNYKWNTKMCSELKHYICQAPAKIVAMYGKQPTRPKFQANVWLEFESKRMDSKNSNNVISNVILV